MIIKVITQTYNRADGLKNTYGILQNNVPIICFESREEVNNYLEVQYGLHTRAAG